MLTTDKSFTFGIQHILNGVKFGQNLVSNVVLDNFFRPSSRNYVNHFHRADVIADSQKKLNARHGISFLVNPFISLFQGYSYATSKSGFFTH